MSFAELVIFVDGVGYSLAARSRDEMFIKKQCILWYLLLKIIFRLFKKTAIFIKIAPPMARPRGILCVDKIEPRKVGIREVASRNTARSRAVGSRGSLPIETWPVYCSRRNIWRATCTGSCLHSQKES